MKGLIFKRDLGLISGIYDSKRNDLRWKEMPYIEGIRSPLLMYVSLPRVSCRMEADEVVAAILGLGSPAYRLVFDLPYKTWSYFHKKC